MAKAGGGSRHRGIIEAGQPENLGLRDERCLE